MAACQEWKRLLVRGKDTNRQAVFPLFCLGIFNVFFEGSQQVPNKQVLFLVKRLLFLLFGTFEILEVVDGLEAALERIRVETGGNGRRVSARCSLLFGIISSVCCSVYTFQIIIIRPQPMTNSMAGDLRLLNLRILTK
jgi:hypothetical protein